MSHDAPLVCIEDSAVFSGRWGMWIVGWSIWLWFLGFPVFLQVPSALGLQKGGLDTAVAEVTFVLQVVAHDFSSIL